jgi:hypothetical protein
MKPTKARNHVFRRSSQRHRGVVGHVRGHTSRGIELLPISKMPVGRTRPLRTCASTEPSDFVAGWSEKGDRLRE